MAEFLLGCVAADTFVRLRSRGAGVALTLGAAGFVAAWAADVAGVGLSRVPAFGLPSALLVYGCAACSWRGPRWLVFLGDASYSLYLVHATLISVLLKLAAAAGILTWVGSAVGNLSIYVATLVAAVVFHRWIEAPLLAACRRGLLGRAWKEKGPDGSSHPALV